MQLKNFKATMDLVFFLPLLLLCILDNCGIPNAMAERSPSRRPGFLDGRRGEMDDDDFAVIEADLTGQVVDNRVVDDNRTPGHREVALASLAILVAGGERTERPSTAGPREDGTRRPVPACQNGGIRLLGSFCYCSPKYMGRYCEIYRYNSSCGRIPHRQWVYLNCNSCFCVAGILKCQPHPMPGCELEGVSTAQPTAKDILEEVLEDNHEVVNYHSSAISRLPSARSIYSLSTAAFLLGQLLIRTRVR